MYPTSSFMCSTVETYPFQVFHGCDLATAFFFCSDLRPFPCLLCLLPSAGVPSLSVTVSWVVTSSFFRGFICRARKRYRIMTYLFQGFCGHDLPYRFICQEALQSLDLLFQGFCGHDLPYGFVCQEALHIYRAMTSFFQGFYGHDLPYGFICQDTLQSHDLPFSSAPWPPESAPGPPHTWPALCAPGISAGSAD